VSVYDVALAFILTAAVLILVADHRRGWLTEILIGGGRAASRREVLRGDLSPRPLNSDPAPVSEAGGAAGD
jgi:hypothetical protein